MEYAENRIRQLSRRYYNQGLDRAKVRDLSGAAEKLRICLHLDKTFTDARNLLGLIYMETGETVAALQEWIISSNLKTVGNPASEYIRRVRENQRELQNRNRSIRGYNEALRSCREGHDDIALIRLRRAVALNPKFVRAYQLMALIEMNNGKLSVARRALKKAEAVDVCNPVTRLYLQEVEAQKKTPGGRAGGERVRPGKKKKCFFPGNPSLCQPDESADRHCSRSSGCFLSGSSRRGFQSFGGCKPQADGLQQYHCRADEYDLQPSGSDTGVPVIRG